MLRRQVRAFLGQTAIVTLGVTLVLGAVMYERFRPVAITLGATTTIYFREPSLETWMHEAIHRR